MKPIRQSLRNKLLRVAFPVILLLALFVSLLISQQRSLTLRQEAHSANEAAADLYAAIATEPVWNLDRQALQAFSNRLLELPNVLEVRFNDENGNSLAAGGKGGRPPGDASAATSWRASDVDDVYSLNRAIYAPPRISQRKVVGHLTVIYSTAHLSKGILQAFAGEFALVLATMLTVLALCYGLFARYVRLPLNALLESIHRTEQSQHFVPVTLSPNDEIGEVIQAYNHMQHTLEAHGQRLRLLYNQSPGLLFSLDAQGLFISVSAYFCAALGYARAELLGHEFLSMLRTIPAADPSVEMLHALNQGRPLSGLQLTVLRKDGSSMHVLLSSVAVRQSEAQCDNFCVMTDISKQIEDQAVINYQANFDAVTRLPNRYAMRNRLQQALQEARQGGHASLAVLFLDLNRFKEVNDTLGHKVGDELLLEFGNRLKAVLGEQAMLCRFGGDEFVILLSSLRNPRDDVQSVGLELLKSCVEPFCSPHRIFMSFSVGAAIFPEDGREAETLLMNADTAMYKSKADGQSALRFFHPDMNDELRRRVEMEQTLRDALLLGRLQLFLQPIVNLSNQGIIAYEALVRMHSYQAGQRERLVLPDEFVPLAEDLGLIAGIGDWMLEQTVALLAHWPGELPGYISVNVSPRQLHDAQLPHRITQLLRQYHVSPQHLVLELTETGLASAPQDAPQALKALDALAATGCMLALDDFGTGYSSLSMLKRMPFGLLKIDRSFIDGLPGDTSACSLVRAIMALAASLNIGVTAEGVEHEAQSEFLSQLGDTLAVQGYLYGRPAPAADWVRVARPRRALAVGGVR